MQSTESSGWGANFQNSSRQSRRCFSHQEKRRELVDFRQKSRLCAVCFPAPAPMGGFESLLPPASIGRFAIAPDESGGFGRRSSRRVGFLMFWRRACRGWAAERRGGRPLTRGAARTRTFAFSLIFLSKRRP